jgi:hypothetical protein
MPEERQRPLLNPVLRLRMDPQPEQQPGGGKNRDSIRLERLPEQRRVLSEAARRLFASRGDLPTYGGRTHLRVDMWPDSLAPSYTPSDLFRPDYGSQLVAPLRRGYLVEAEVDALPRLARTIEDAGAIGLQCDISRIKAMDSYGRRDRLRNHSIDDLWDTAPADDEGRLFIVWLAPFRSPNAREDLLQQVQLLSRRQVLIPTFTSMRLLRGVVDTEEAAGAVTAPNQGSVARALRGYRSTGIARAAVRIPSKDALKQLVASGISHRIDPVRYVRVAAPGEGAEPPPPGNVGDAPVVGVVDGGLHARSYAAAEAWRAPPLVSNSQADRVHGSAISSLVVQGHAWNTNRLLPQLFCRIGTVQTVPHRNANRRFDERETIDYLRAVMQAHPDTHVWNISANQDGASLDPDEVSLFGQELSELARTMNILPVVSVGNVRRGSGTRPNPPADCEAALVVGGRQADTRGNPAEACPHCLGGPGPDGMLKPDVSWFSRLRMIGGVTATGSSYPTALMSSLAAHTYDNLREPTPDLTKALLINTCELAAHDANLVGGRLITATRRGYASQGP